MEEKDISYGKISKLMKSKPTNEDLRRFKKKNPNTIRFAPKERVEKGIKGFEEFVKSHPIGSILLLVLLFFILIYIITIIFRYYFHYG
ncbi:MAG: hypothetical protein ACXABG_09795 [Promethearchaeota archaeon]|jgi:pilus assembly protein TadC